MGFLLLLIFIIYVLSPIDLLPDYMVPVAGWFDDILLGYILFRIYRKKFYFYSKNSDTSKENIKFENKTIEKSPHEILGLSPYASKDEIKKAYKDMAMKYHPDRVIHLGEEFQDLANKKFKEIQNAYDRLIGK